MKLKQSFILVVAVVILNNCGGGTETNTIDQQTQTSNTIDTSTVVNNEAVSFPKSTELSSVPTDQLPKN